MSQVLQIPSRANKGSKPKHPARHLTKAEVDALKHEKKAYEIRDTHLRGLIVRVQPAPSKTKSYILQYGRNKRIRIGRTDVLTPTKARKIATKLLGKVADGIDLQSERKESKRAEKEAKAAAKLEREKKKNALTLLNFIDGPYKDWFIMQGRKYGAGEVSRLKSRFKSLLNIPLEEISKKHVDGWRKSRVAEKDGPTLQTINRDLAALKAAMSRAHEEDLIKSNPIRRVKLAKIDSNPKPRFLSTKEEQRLLKAVDKVNQSTRQQLIADGETHFSSVNDYPYANRIKPMLIVAMHTGIRRGEIFSLRWGDIDLKGRILTVQGKTAKGHNTRHVPLNADSLDALSKWKKQSQNSKANDLVFPANDGHSRLDSIRVEWDQLRRMAKLKNFRWHDLRHHFASRLVQEGVDLNVVRELLGHSDYRLTLRYAHLDPDNMADAVAKIERRK